jgi:hypothetical protein
MTKLMQPRQTLLGCARNEARSLSNKLKYDFLIGSNTVDCRSRRLGRRKTGRLLAA